MDQSSYYLNSFECGITPQRKNLIKMNFLSKKNIKNMKRYVLLKRKENDCFSSSCSEVGKRMHEWLECKTDYFLGYGIEDVDKLNIYFLKENSYLYNVYTQSGPDGYVAYDLEPIKNNVDINYNIPGGMINVNVNPKRITGMDLPNMDFWSPRADIDRGMFIKTYKKAPGTRTSHLSSIYDLSNDGFKNPGGFGRSLENDVYAQIY